MTGILITGGDLPDFHNVKHFFKEADTICAADSGYDWAIDNSIDCDHVVGDMDSLNDIEVLDKVKDKVILFNVDKDDTDTHIGLKLLKSKGCNKIILIGGGGGRIDHLLGIFSFYQTDLFPDIWITGIEKIYLIQNSKFSLEKWKDSSISVYPIGEVNCSIHSYGLKWDLGDVCWNYKSIGVSNKIVKKQAWIDPGGNRVLLIFPILGKKFE